MKLIIPIGPKDADNLDLLVHVIPLLGGVKQPLLLVSVPSQFNLALKAVETLQPTCPNIEAVSTETEFADGWPMGNNRMFHWVGNYQQSTGCPHGWLWLEPDCCPLVAGWSDMIENEYRAMRKPYMGFVRATRHIDFATNTPFFKPNDNMLMGVAVYPPKMLEDQELAPLFRSLGLPSKQAHPKHPWDLTLRWKFFKRGVHETNLIHDKWRTINYRREGTSLVCDPMPDVKDGAPTGGTIPASAVLVHGCKDGSLQKLIIEEHQKVRTPKTPESLPPVAVPLVTPPPTLFLTGSPVSRVQAVLNDMVAAGTRPRVSAIADATSLSPDVVKTTLTELGHTFIPIGWVTLKKQEEEI